MREKRNLFDMLVGNVPTGREEEYYNYSLLPDLETFNTADTVNMNNNEMNKFRHIAGSKQALNDLGLFRGMGALLYKEYQDMRRDGDWLDTKQDLKNDVRALKLYIKNPNLDGEQLYKHTFDAYIKPYRK